MAKADALFRSRRPGRPVKAKLNEKDAKTGFDGNWDLVVRKCSMTFSQHVSEVTTSQVDTKVRGKINKVRKKKIFLIKILLIF